MFSDKKIDEFERKKEKKPTDYLASFRSGNGEGMAIESILPNFPYCDVLKGYQLARLFMHF
jgi:hypothetical protein